MKQQIEQTERIYRLAPCSGYDIAEMESWLEYMAQQGYLLQKNCPEFGGRFCQRPAAKLALPADCDARK